MIDERQARINPNPEAIDKRPLASEGVMGRPVPRFSRPTNPKYL